MVVHSAAHWDDVTDDAMVACLVDSLVGSWGKALVLQLTRSDKDKAVILMESLGTPLQGLPICSEWSCCL